MFKLSQYLHPIENTEFFALWHSLNFNKLYGDHRLREVITDLQKVKFISGEQLHKYSPAIIQELLQQNFLCPIDYNEDYIFNELIQKSEIIEIRNLVLLLSNACNFNCVYCQIEKNIKQPKIKLNMTQEIASKALDLFINNSPHDAKKTITITGGEPLLNPDIFKFVVEKAAKINNKRIVLFTNGSMITDELIKLFKEHQVLVLLSIDGPKVMHDCARVDQFGKGTYQTVISAYQKLKENQVNVGISAVGGKHNIEDLWTLIDFFIKLRPSSVGLNFSHYLLAEDNPMAIPIAEFGKILVEFYQALREENIFVENISRIIQAFVSQQPRLHECQAEGTGFTVDARGKIGPCKSLLVADIYAAELDPMADLTKHEMFLQWNQRTPLRINKCRSCSSIMMCGGGCAYDSYIINQGNFHQIDPRVCEYQNYVLRFLFEDLFSKIKERFYGKIIYAPTKEEQLQAFCSYYDPNNSLQRSVGHESR